MSFADGGPDGTDPVLRLGFSRVPAVAVPAVAVAVLHRSTFYFHFSCIYLSGWLGWGPGGDIFPPGSGLPYIYRESLYVIISVFCVYCGLYTYQ
jgi:hypothetical protein